MKMKWTLFFVSTCLGPANLRARRRGDQVFPFFRSAATQMGRRFAPLATLRGLEAGRWGGWWGSLL